MGAGLSKASGICRLVSRESVVLRVRGVSQELPLPWQEPVPLRRARRGQRWCRRGQLWCRCAVGRFAVLVAPPDTSALCLISAGAQLQ